MFCAKCHQKEATIHFTTVVAGKEEEAVHLCKDCAPPTGFDLDKLDLKEIEALSVIGKKCEFCRRDAFSGEMRAKGGAIYWCFDCGLEIGGIVRDLLVAALDRTSSERMTAYRDAAAEATDLVGLARVAAEIAQALAGPALPGLPWGPSIPPAPRPPLPQAGEGA